MTVGHLMKFARSSKSYMICLSTVIWLTPVGSSTYTFINKQYTERHKTNNT